MRDYTEDLQRRICAALEAFEETRFVNYPWDREGGGGGTAKILQGGKVFEKGGVNVACVQGTLSPEIAHKLKIKEGEFAACGLSLVVHPFSPKIPTVHLNIRFFEKQNGEAWFGGGMDLTPYYPYEEDFRHFHQVLFKACEKIERGSYQKYKEECDRYFYLTHRGEGRGVGGIFFDYLKEDLTQHFQFVQSVGDAFLPAYVPILEKRCEESFNEEDKNFQLNRRGRYVEFNLIYDRGTLFGLATQGNIEAILMSLPPIVHFTSHWKPKPGSIQEKMLQFYQPRGWLAGQEKN